MPASDAPAHATSGAILAGGRARRFGGADKSALLVNGRRIVDHHLDLLRRLTTHVFIVGHSPERFASLEVDVVADLVEDAGPLAGLWTALSSAPSAQVLVLACDLPLVTAPLLRELVAVLEQHPEADAVVPRDGRGRHPLCGCYRTRCAPLLAARVRAGRLKVLDALTDLTVVDVGPDRLRELDPGGRALTNVNTPEDYAALGPA
jgi:molybdopterin-guanine dinucleotide biosynthesis protein A